jgi:putative transposase
MIKGRKRHILTDTIGLPVGMIVHPANIQDRDGAPGLLASVRSLYLRLRHVFADGAPSDPRRYQHICPLLEHLQKRLLVFRA